MPSRGRTLCAVSRQDSGRRRNWRYLPVQALLLALVLCGHGVGTQPAPAAFRQDWRFPQKVLRIPAGLPVGTVVAAWQVPLPVWSLQADAAEQLSLREGQMPWHQRWLMAPTSVPGLMLRVVSGNDGGDDDGHGSVPDALRMELVTSGQVKAGWLDGVNGPLWWALSPEGTEMNRTRLLMQGRMDYTGRLKVETGYSEWQTNDTHHMIPRQLHAAGQRPPRPTP